MSTLVTTLSPTDASQTEILARHLFNEERTAENADLDLEQYIQKLDGLHEGDGCLLSMVLHPACHDDPVEFYNLHGFFPDNLRRK
jgi:hypothetical protein